MAIRNIIVELRNTTGSTITMGTLNISAASSEIIWDTTNYSVGATDNFEQVLSDPETFNEAIGNGDLVMEIDNVDQSSADAWAQFYELQISFTDERIKDEFSILRQEGESTLGLDIEAGGDVNVNGNDITNVGLVDGVDVSDHSARHENGGADEISVAGLSGVLADPQTPASHASTHISGGGDEIDGDQIDIDWNPTNYTPTTTPTEVTSLDHLTAHLAGIDTTLGTVVTDHGGLTGLLDDDHTQYLLVDGTRAMSGNLNMGTNNITNVGTVDGVDVSTHASRHENGGADEISVAGLSGLLADPQTPTAHASTHITSGSDEIDGDQLDIDFTPSNYTPITAPAEVTDLDHLSAHLAGIDTALGTVVTDHGALTGLGDDDHTQYLLVDGTRAMSGDLDMGTNDITNVGTVDGVDVSTHAARHENGGADEINVAGLSGLLADPQTPTSHASTHISSGSDEMDGDQLDIDWNPSNYTPTTSPTEVTSLDHLTAHLAGIDAALAGFGTGDVVGPASATDNAIARYDGGTGKLIQNSGVTIDDSGNMNLGAGNITTSGTVDGVDVSAHGSRHLPAGADPLTTAAPPGTAVQIGNAAAVGTANSFARSDHVHAVAAGTPVNVTKSANSAGVAATFARSDHKHDITTAAAVGLSANSTNAEGGATSLARSNHTHAIDVTTGTLSTVNAGDTAVNGTAAGLARRDHQHPVATATASTLSGSNAEGASTSLARADHNHALGGTVGGDLSGTLPNPTVTDLTISGETHGDVLYRNATNWVRLAPGTSGQALLTQGAAANPIWGAPSANKVVTVEFALDENVSNFQQYFFTWRGTGSDTTTGKRSGASSGIQNANACTPYQVPFDATIISAVLTLRGAGVQNGSVTYPVTFQTDLFEQGFTSESKIADIDFSISNSFTVGTFAPAATNFKGTTSLNIDVDTGDMLGLKFINGTGASLVGQLRNAFVTLVLEER